MSSDTTSTDGNALVIAPAETINEKLYRNVYVCLSTVSVGLEYLRLRKSAFEALQHEGELVQGLALNNPKGVAEHALIMKECTQISHSTGRYCKEYGQWERFRE
jgi:hypothetical protein